MSPPGRNDLLSSLEADLCDDDTVEFVVVFGSRVDGMDRANADLDVAVKFNDDCSPAERFSTLCRLSGRVQRDAFPFIDLSDIEELPLQIARAAIDGMFLCGDHDSFERTSRAIRSEFETKRSTIERDQRQLIERIAKDGLHG